MLTYDPETAPFKAPPETAPVGYMGWRYDTEPDPDNPGRWRPVAWVLVYPPDHPDGGGILTIDYRSELCVKDSALYHPVGEL